MKHVMVRYRVKRESAQENESYIRAVFEVLARERPHGVRYASFKLEDGVSFVHIASLANDDNPLLAVTAFKRFTEKIRDRCEQPPVSAELTAIGEYDASE